MSLQDTPVIPKTITVHLGAPDEVAENITVPFDYYIKNVASSELYPTWPESALRANILAQISFALNRVYTEFYRTKGKNFDITNNPAYDQAFYPKREIFENVGNIVDEIFNNYVTKEGNIQPLFTSYCDGIKVKCDGLSQWGSVSLSNQGKNDFEILQNYYGNNIELVENSPVEGIAESYPGFPLVLGTSSNSVQEIQVQLNRIAKNYPAIKPIQSTDGIFRKDTQEAVKTFQKIFSLPETGLVDKATWYKIKGIYNAVKQLSELISEGLKLEEVTRPYQKVLKEGDSGKEVEVLQYYLAVLGYFNANLPQIKVNGVFDRETKLAVQAFQKLYGLADDGIVGKQTWAKLVSVYQELLRTLPLAYNQDKTPIYPGKILVLGSKGEEVTQIETALNFISESYPAISKVKVDGVFEQDTENSVKAFQKQFQLEQTGAVGAITWNKIAETYDELKLSGK